MLEQGYGIMPNTILFNDNLKDKEKLLYCFISSLCAKEGYCYATNKYIAEMLNVKRTGGEKRKGKLTSQTISSYISSLQKHGYINITLVYKPKTKQIKERIIKLNSLLNKEDPINKLVNTYPLNKEDPINKLTKDNNISNNITNNNINNIYNFGDFLKKEFDEEFIKDLFIKYNLSEKDFKEESQNFINYRGEKSPNGKKEKWQKEKTFDPRLRFHTWLRNNKKWSKTIIVNTEDEERKQKLAEIEQKKKKLYSNFK